MKHRLLIVDDQSANIRVMAEVLRDEYELYFATTGVKALEVATANDVELVLLDVVMPDLDGFEVCRRLKTDERTSRIPVIFVTAREEMSDEERGFDCGAVDYITKPIRPPIVRARVRTHLELKEARDLLESMASIDGLTAIANRRRFDVVLGQEWKRAIRSGSPISVAMIDVDEFKKFNDSYGHARGDDCLRSVAGVLQSITRRPPDLAARYGGEEFAIVFPDTDADAMPLLLARLLERVRELGIAHARSSCSDRVTVSAGAVSLVPQRDSDPSSAIEAADRLLYEVKRGGRNHAVHADLTRGTKQRIDSAAAAVRETS